MLNHNMKMVVSIGVPTFNRPEGLRLTLEKIVVQTYPHLEIIISDNHSTDKELLFSVVDSFNDDRIKLHYQEENIGAVANFQYVLKNSSGAFFMWAADDDYFEDHNLIERLLAVMEKEPLTGMVFPDFNFIEKTGNIKPAILSKKYASCKTPSDFQIALCKSGVGHPVYGLYRREVLTDGLMKLLSSDIVYFNEGVYLHGVFLNTQVTFLPGVFIRYLGSDIFDKRKKNTIIRDFIKYTWRLLGLYKRSALNPGVKMNCMYLIFIRHSFAAMKFLFK